MKVFNLKSLVGAAALGFALMAGTSDASAQVWGRNNQAQTIRQQQRLERERLMWERARIRRERQRL
ncbi:MAG TPA: hypothetical protein VMZ26_03425, partial [Pyrinomonadaceae bacterium]|nr:hypothetical protein [Pyrinomonadaceae bacterium]